MMPGTIRYFLIVYDRRTGTQIEFIDFGADRRAATTAYGEKERVYSDGTRTPRIEVVLLGSDSVDTLRATHGNYFGESLGTHLTL